MEKTGTKNQSKIKSKYVDGFVIVMNKKNLPAYIKMAKTGEKIWKEYGALDYKECAGEELDIKMGLPFPELLKIKKNETVIFSWITYTSKAHRNKVNSKVMSEPRIAKSMEGKKMPFEMNRMSVGGFKIIVG